ncbi:MAG: preprotein translocase subunit YajC [Duodenibacillus sp.]|nr:preprotein translocase subunit YajC [Duodenibacillus sp.]
MKGTEVFFISDAMAQTAGAAPEPGLAGFAMQIVPILLIFAVFWFFLIRPQQKKQKEHAKMCAELAKGDEVMTASGIAGRIASLSEQYIVIEVSKAGTTPVCVTMMRGAVTAVLPKGTLQSI